MNCLKVTNHLLKKPGHRFGLDLVAFNMQRGREFGVPGYMHYRKFCGLPTADSFEELFGSMPNSTIYRYSSIFAHPNDIDLWSGGVSERPLPGSMLGPTFACIIATQMSFVRRGDRFWYELPNQPSSFTPEQLQEIRKVKLSRILCDNTDLLDTVQIYPMVLPDHEINPRVPCKSGVIPSLDLTKWAEFPSPSQYSAPKATGPTSAPQEILIVCNGTGCNVPSQNPVGQPTITNVQENAIVGSNGNVDGASILQGDKLANTLSIIASSPVLFIQRLRKRFEEGSNNRTTREKRSVQDRRRIESKYSTEDRYPLGSEKDSSENDEMDISVTNVSLAWRKDNYVQEPTLYPRLNSYKKNQNTFKNISEGPTLRKARRKVQSPDRSDKSVKSKNTTKGLNQLTNNNPRVNSRSDLFHSDESNVDYIQTTHNDRGGAGHYSLFKNPVYDNNDDYDDEIILGGTNRDHDGTTPFPIVDVDHDYDGEFEYVKLEDEGSKDSKEDNSGNYVEDNKENKSEKSFEPEPVKEGTQEEGSKEGENDGSEEIVKYPPVVVFYKGDPKNFNPNSQFEDIQERYITKDPLAGPGATRGFNHDFKVMRGVPLQGGQGGVVVQPNTRFPTVPGFNTSQIHNIIKVGRLPGVIGPGPNFTKVGIIPIEPARHARPNDLGDYLGFYGLYGNNEPPRRPVPMKPPPYYGRRPLYNGYPVKSQRVALRKPGRYMRPLRLSSHSPPPVRHQVYRHPYRSRGNGRTLLRVKVIDNRASDGDEEEYVPTEDGNKDIETLKDNINKWDDNSEEITDDAEDYDEQEHKMDQKGLINEPNTKDSYKYKTSNNYKTENENTASTAKRKDLNMNPSYDHKSHTETSEQKKVHQRTYKIKTPKIRKPKILKDQKRNGFLTYDEKGISRHGNSNDSARQLEDDGNSYEKDLGSQHNDGEIENNSSEGVEDESEHEMEQSSKEQTYEQSRTPKYNSKVRNKSSDETDYSSEEQKHNEDRIPKYNSKPRKMYSNDETENSSEEQSNEEDRKPKYNFKLRHKSNGETEHSSEEQINEEERNPKYNSKVRDKSNDETENSSEELTHEEGRQPLYNSKPRSKPNTQDDDIDEPTDISKTLAKIIQRTKDLENDKITTNGEEPVSYNNYWTLEYSLPNYR